MLQSERGRFIVLLMIGTGLWAVAIVGIILWLVGLVNEPVQPGLD